MTKNAILKTRGLSRKFGHLIAVDGVDLSVAPGTIHALIGPNGAGKTTVVNMLAGTFPPSAGTIYFSGNDVTGMSSNRLCRQGIGRTFQRSRVLGRASVRENIRLGAMGPSVGLFSSFRKSTSAVASMTEQVLTQCQLGAVAGRVADQLSHGERRVLEIAMTLAGNPSLLLLDEPLAGTGSEEGHALSALIRSLAGRHTIILVEHDMDAVFRIADEITVLVGGKILASGAPQDIRTNADVQEAYLGHGDGTVEAMA